MAFRATAAARQAHLSGGLSDLFDGNGNNLNLVFKAAVQSGDVDTINAGSVIATLAAADEGASNINGSYADPTDDGTTASALIRTNLSGNATAAHNYADGNDGAGVCEVFVGTGRTAGDKVGDFTVGGPGTTGTFDLTWDVDAIALNGLLTVTAVTFTQT